MAYIYKIVNDINDKVYIGKTEFSVEKRFKEHCKDSKKRKNENRPLYRAMNKYGIEHFFIEMIEETSIPEEREIYWIDYYDSYHNGYNATCGGDGMKLLNYELIISTYLNLQNAAHTARVCGVSIDSVKNILHAHNIDMRPPWIVTKEIVQKAVGMYDKNEHGVLIREFASIREAAKYLKYQNENILSELDKMVGNIVRVCKGQRCSAFGFYWKYL